MIEAPFLTIQIAGKSLRVVQDGNSRFWSLVNAKEWEPETFLVFDRFIDSESSYIDIGAWIGPTLLYGANLAKKAYALEPDPLAFAQLKANLSMNPELAPRARIFQLCLALKTGPTPFGSRNAGGDSMSSLLFADAKTQWTVEGIRFDEFLKENQITDCNFIKMDIEGGEYQILPSMKNHLKKHRPTLFLSLHPFFLGPQNKLGLTAKILRILTRLWATTQIYILLAFYKNFFDSSGRRLSYWHLMYKSFCGKSSSVVMTDLDWDFKLTSSNRKNRHMDHKNT